MNLNHAVALGIMLMLILSGVCIGYMVWGRQVFEIVEKPAAPVWHDDGGMTAGRDPAAKPDLPETSAPPGGVLIRTVEVTVRPRPVPREETAGTDTAAPRADAIAATECRPITVRLDMREYREGPDLGVRVSVRAEGGEVLDSVDIPRDSIYMPRYTKSVIGADRIGDTTTVRYQRSIGALDIGPALTFPDGQRAGVGLSVAWRF